MSETIDTDAFIRATRRRQRRAGTPCAASLLSPHAQALLAAGVAAGMTASALAATLRDPDDGTGEVIAGPQITRHFVRRECKCWDD